MTWSRDLTNVTGLIPAASYKIFGILIYVQKVNTREKLVSGTMRGTDSDTL